MRTLAAKFPKSSHLRNSFLDQGVCVCGGAGGSGVKRACKCVCVYVCMCVHIEGSVLWVTPSMQSKESLGGASSCLHIGDQGEFMRGNS